MLKSLFVEGDTYLHRMNVKLKLGLLLVASLALYLIPLTAVQAIAALIAAALYFNLGMSIREALMRIRPVLFTIAILGLVNVFVVSPEQALTLTLRLVAILFLAAAITATSTIEQFMDAIADFLKPLDRLGLVKAADVSLSVGLVLRFVPDIFNHYEALKEAHAARGIPVKTVKMIVPLIMLTLKDADTIAQAIDARGVRGQ